jgi:hypothetical protein
VHLRQYQALGWPFQCPDSSKAEADHAYQRRVLDKLLKQAEYWHEQAANAKPGYNCSAEDNQKRYLAYASVTVDEAAAIRYLLGVGDQKFLQR